MLLDVDPDFEDHILLKAIRDRLIDFATEDKQVVLFVDEAHVMPEPTLEALRLLSNYETETAKLLQIVLFAQPEINAVLDRPSLRQLRQRIAMTCEIEALDRDGLERYVSHRLSTAGYHGPFLFSRRALDYLYRASEGVPRMINILCHKSMMVAFTNGERSVEVDSVREAVNSTDGIGVQAVSGRLAFLAMGAVTKGLVLVLSLGWLSL